MSYNGRAVGEQEIKARLNQDATIYNLRRKKPYLRSLATKARARGDRVGAFDRGVIAPIDDEVRM